MTASAVTLARADNLSCLATGVLSTRDRIRRKAFAYVASSPDGASESCANCKFYRSGSLDTCGTCSMVPGPIHSAGYCRLWAGS